MGYVIKLAFAGELVRAVEAVLEGRQFLTCTANRLSYGAADSVVKDSCIRRCCPARPPIQLQSSGLRTFVDFADRVLTLNGMPDPAKQLLAQKLSPT